jgi:20S proteasome subunit alpha 3
MLQLLTVVEFATVGKNAQGKVEHRIWKPEEIDALLKKEGLLKEKEEETS